MAQITLNSSGVASNGALALQSNGTTTAVTVDASQNVGIGTSSPTTKLVVSGTTTAIDSNGQILATVTDTVAADKGGQIMMGGYYTGTTPTAFGGIAGKKENGTSGSFSGYLQFLTSTGGTGNTEKARIDSSGNLGIGTTSPDDITSGYTTIDVRGSTGGGLRLGASGGNNMAIYASASTSVIEASGSSALQLVVNAAERARIDSSGNLLVGRTSPRDAEAFSVAATRNNFIGEFASTGSSGNPNVILAFYPNFSPNNATGDFVRGADSTTTRFSLRSNGGLANYSANDANLSDRREKTNFAPATSYLDKICAIPVQTFNYIDQNLEEDAGLTLGVVAQDVQAVAPELVMESNWSNKDEEPKMRLSIYQTDLQYALMKALQELNAKFEAYKASHP